MYSVTSASESVCLSRNHACAHTCMHTPIDLATHNYTILASTQACMHNSAFVHVHRLAYTHVYMHTIHEWHVYCFLLNNVFFACRLADINCEAISGISKGAGYHPGKEWGSNPKSDHAWNKVQIRGTWYLCDPTWAAGSVGRFCKS